jgi:hypothetical protein
LQEVFTRATAHAYHWVGCAEDTAYGIGPAVESGITDMALDQMLPPRHHHHLSSHNLSLHHQLSPPVPDPDEDEELASVRSSIGGRSGSRPMPALPPPPPTSHCPVVKLNSQQLIEQVQLLRDGLLGKGEMPVSFSIVCQRSLL